jgi:hypothetical protein
MSALGQKQTFAVHQPMSALPPKATLNAFIRMSAMGQKRTSASAILFWVYACFLVSFGWASKLAAASFFGAPALLSIRDPILILIVPVGVISTAEIGKPAASTPAMARTMSPVVKRRGPSFLFLFGILRGGTRCHATSTDLTATVVRCSGVPKFRRAIMSFDTCGI